MDSEFACPLCSHVSRTIKGYISHYQYHSNEYRRFYDCPVRECKRKLLSYTGLRTHIYRNHEKTLKTRQDDKHLAINLNIKLQCTTPLCHQVCDGMQDLFKHLRNHLDEDTSVKCPFHQCCKIFSKKNTFSAHVSRYHRNHTVKDLPCEMICSSNSDFFDDTDRPMSSNSEYSSVTKNSIGDFDDVCVEEMQKPEDDLFLRNLAMFYLKLLSKYLVPASVIQCIVDEFKSIHSLGISFWLQKLTTLLKDHDIPEQKAKEIVYEIQESDIFSKCNNGSLRSDHCRTSYFKEKLNYSQPQCLHLGKNNQNRDCSFQYVPILQTIKCLFRDELVCKEHKLTAEYLDEDASETYFKDISNGLCFKSHNLFKDDPNALRLILYQDAFEICNPLGSSKKKHKIIGVYMTLGKFRPHLRSVVDNALLVLLCKEADLKHFGQDKVFHELIKDLKELETNGIEICNKTVKGTLFCITGDNLGSHGIGGFTENFSTVEHFCRYCTITLSEFQRNPLYTGTKRTVENYNSVVKDLERENCIGISNLKGIKFNSVFNALNYYHVCQPGLPPCL